MYFPFTLSLVAQSLIVVRVISENVFSSKKYQFCLYCYGFINCNYFVRYLCCI